MKRNRALFLCQAALVAALYVTLTYVARLFGLDSGVIQLRISEALCVLPMLMPAAIPGLYVGCLIANLLMNAMWMDVLIGPIATLLGALGTYALRRYRWLAPLPPVLANVLLIPPVLAFGYGVTEAFPFLMLTIGIGEALSIYGCGMLLYFAIKKRNIRL